MYLTKYIKLLIVSLTILTLTTLVSVNSQANTTCTTNALGDRTCTTVTSGTTTGNVLTNSTFGTGNSTTTTGWSSDGHKHTHANFGNFPYQSGMDTSGGVWAGEGHTDDNLYQDVDLVGDSHLTKAQVNEGFTSTMSADVWFWNNIENDFTMKQTITAADGTVTTQIRIINDHDPSRNMNGGTFTNYTNVYTESANSQNDYTIRVEMYNETAGTAYDNTHRGPDVDNVQLSITTAGVESITITPCSELGTCTSIGEDVAEAVDLTTDDGVDLFQDLDTKVEEAIKDFEEVEVISIDTTMLIEDDLGEIEEVKFEEFIQESFTEFLETNDLVEEFKTELKVEGITEDEFFEELGNEMMEEIGGDMMTEIISLDEEMIEEPKMDEMIEEPKMEEFKEEEMEMEEIKEEEIANEPEIKEEGPQEEVKEEVNQEEVKEESTETESNANTETTTKTEDTSEESMENEQEGEPSSEESTMDENTEAEGSETETNNEEAVDDEATVDDKQADNKIDSVNVKVKRIIAKLEKTLKDVNDQVKAVQFVTLKGIQAEGADLTSYQGVQLNDTIKLNDGNPDFFNQLNIEQEQVYTNVNLNAYSNNDPITIKKEKLQQIDIEKQRLIYEIQNLKKG